MDKTIFFKKNNFSMTSKFFLTKSVLRKKSLTKREGGEKGFPPPGFENVGIPFKDLPFSFYLPFRIFLILFRGCFLLFSSSSLKVCYSTQPTKRKRREFSRHPQRCLFSSSSALLELVASTVAEAEHCAKGVDSRCIQGGIYVMRQ